MSDAGNGALRVGLAGLGTVGGGVVSLLAANADIVAARAGRRIEVVAVAARDRGRDRGLKLGPAAWFTDAAAMATDAGVDVVVEAIGGAEGAARRLVEAALAAGKPVVTANKALLAVHGAALARAAEAHGTPLAFEAAVGGGIPVIKALREGLAGNRITSVAGILNGTCNHILTTMRSDRRDFADVLAEAQALGYAEADPAMDVDGIDAAHKLAILAAIAFGRPVAFEDVHVEGIRGISMLDIGFAEELGYRIKLLGIARREGRGISTRVHPCMLPAAAPLARVDGVFNAVVAVGDHVGRVMLEGRGAGAGPTASAVVADLIDIARGRAAPVWGAGSGDLSNAPSMPVSEHVGPAYLRLLVVDQPGVIADVAAILRDEGVSLGSMLQRGRKPGEAVPVVLVTHDAPEAAIDAALARIDALRSVLERPVRIRIEEGDA